MDLREGEGQAAIREFAEKLEEIYPELKTVGGIEAAILTTVQNALSEAQSTDVNVERKHRGTDPE